MDFRVAARDLYNSFNSFLGVVLRRPNAVIVGVAGQLQGEFSEVIPFERCYDYYNRWPPIKSSTDVKHQKFVGHGFETSSNSPAFDKFCRAWEKQTGFHIKLSNAVRSMLITGTMLLERQYHENALGNVEHIPMQSIFKAYRDAFGNYTKLQQLVDGIFKDIDPKYYVIHTINNPDRKAFGRSDFFTVAAPRLVGNPSDPARAGSGVNPGRVMTSILDAQARIQNAQVEIIEKMAKPKVVVSVPGMPAEQMKQLEAELEDPASSKYVWAFNKDAKIAEAQINPATKFDSYNMAVQEQIDLATQFGSKVVTNPGAFSYAGLVESDDVLDERLKQMRNELTEVLLDQIYRELYETWFPDMVATVPFESLEVTGTWAPITRRVTLQDIALLDPMAVSPEEKRALYKAQNIKLDDAEWEEFQMRMAAMTMPAPGGPEGPDRGPLGSPPQAPGPGRPSPGGSRPSPGGEAAARERMDLGRIHGTGADPAAEITNQQTAKNWNAPPSVTDSKVITRIRDDPLKDAMPGAWIGQAEPGPPLDVVSKSLYHPSVIDSADPRQEGPPSGILQDADDMVFSPIGGVPGADNPFGPLYPPGGPRLGHTVRPGPLPTTKLNTQTPAFGLRPPSPDPRKRPPRHQTPSRL